MQGVVGRAVKCFCEQGKVRVKVLREEGWSFDGSGFKPRVCDVAMAVKFVHGLGCMRVESKTRECRCLLN